MKKILYIISTLICFFMFASNVSAEVYKVRIIESYANMRPTASTDGKIVEVLEQGTVHTLISPIPENNYYKIISASGKEGYVHENYSIQYLASENETPVTACEKSLYEKGFTEPSYWPYLCFLEEVHPTWVFTPLITNLDFEDAVKAESACGTSATSKTGSYIDTSCPNNFAKGWYPASQTAVAYYMDPRNFLNENYIFQFERVSYDDRIGDSYPAMVDNMLENASFYTYHKDKGLNLSTVINDVGKNESIKTSPVFIAARMLQELGSSTTLFSLYSGVYTDDDYGDKYVGYFNFYNWGVSDTCVDAYGTAYCGLSTAMRYEWNTAEKAILGGVNSIAINYINANQDTLYLQKYNVMPELPNELYAHQYMTNIHAPSSEGKIMSGVYNSAGFLDNSFEFFIPVYNNMGAEITNEGSGGSGDEDDDLTTLDINTIITNSGYLRDNGYLTKIAIGSDIANIISNIESAAGKGNVSATDVDGNIKTEGIAKTGDKITVKNTTESITITIIIYGDTSGDGLVNALDLLQVQKQILGSYNLTGIYAEAGDTSKEGKIDALDLLQIQKQILGSYTIIQ